MAKSLRSNEHKVIGSASSFPENVLPTKSDVVKRVQLSKDHLEFSTGKQKIKVSQMLEPVLEELADLWKKASIPTITKRGIERAVTKLWEHSKQGLKNEQSKTQAQEENQKLFDICACKCPQISCIQARCQAHACDDIHLDCKCDSSSRVPRREIKFLFDQRGPRKMLMSGLDRKVTQSLKRSFEKAEAFEAQQEKEKKRRKEEEENNAVATREFFAEEAEEAEGEEKDDVEDQEKNDPTFGLDGPKSADPGPKTRNTHALPKTGAACDRWGISSKAAADLVNSFAIDMGMLTDSNKSTMTTDKAKIDRWRKAGRKKANTERKKAIGSKDISGIYFDGKKDFTLTMVEKNGKPYPRKVIEDHYVMLGEPENVYLGHEVPYSGHGISIGLRLFRSLKAKNLAAKMIVAGADGCNVNVGNNEGALVYLELLLGKPLHWFICMLHGCELPFRALVRKLDGGTSGPLSLKGPIGSSLGEELTEEPVVNFRSIPNPDFPTVAEEDSYELSKAQRYTYRMCHAIMSGEMPPGLADEEPGAYHGARWNTLANRLMRKYVSTPRPSRNFRKLIHSIIHHYAPSWFQIKTHPRCVDGPKNLYKMVEYQRKLEPDLQKEVQIVMQRNAYFAHPEAILLSMLADSDEEVRSQAVNTIMTIRMKSDQARADLCEEDNGRGVDEEDEDEEEPPEGEDDDAFRLDPSEDHAISNSKVRKFVLPKVNFNATSYTELIDWESAKLTEPPFTLDFKEADLLAIKEAPLEVPHYPCHTQAVERAIKIVSEASAAVVGQEAREGFISQRIKERQELTKFESKRDYFQKVEAACKPNDE